MLATERSESVSITAGRNTHHPSPDGRPLVVSTDGAARAMPDLFEHCRAVTKQCRTAAMGAEYNLINEMDIAHNGAKIRGCVKIHAWNMDRAIAREPLARRSQIQQMNYDTPPCADKQWGRLQRRDHTMHYRQCRRSPSLRSGSRAVLPVTQWSPSG